MWRIYCGSEVHTDDHGAYNRLPCHKHRMVNHSAGEDANGNVHTQTIESVWAIIKHAHMGVYRWWSAKHFDLYLREFEMCSNLPKRSEGRRFEILLPNVNGTRLSYEDLTSGDEKDPDACTNDTKDCKKEGKDKENVGQAFDDMLTPILNTPPQSLPLVEHETDNSQICNTTVQVSVEPLLRTLRMKLTLDGGVVKCR